MSNINFDNPYLLLIAVPLIVLFTVPFVLAVRKDNRNAHNVASQVMHVLLAIIIAFAAAGTSITTVLTQTHVIVVADVSYSANKNLDTIDNIIRDQLKLPNNSKVGIVTFGKNYELLCDLTDQNKVKSVKESIESKRIDDSETNIAEALEYAGTLFSDEVIKRVVLITDAKQTDDVDTSAMRRAVDYLESREVKVDAYFLDNNLTSEKPEVQISGAEFTASAFINHEESVTVTIQSNVETKAILYLSKNGVDIDSKDAELTVGKNSESIKLKTDESGTFDYEVRIKTIPEENDSSDYNNNYKFTQTVSSDLKVLVVTNEWADVPVLIEQYGESATIDVYENDIDVYLSEKAALNRKYADNDKINVYCFNNQVLDNDQVVKKSVPYSIEEICVYDEIVLSNLDVRTITSPTKFVQSLDIAVATFGKSLVTLGNTYIQDAPQSSVLKSLSDILPVRFGKSDDEAKLYTIILDSSRSMFMGGETSKIALAKAYTKKLVSTLNEGDQISIIGFYGDAWMIYGPKSYSDSAEIMERIDAVTVKQGTVLSGALQMAKDTMGGEIADLYGDKQIMIITDGKDNAADFDKSRELVTSLLEEDDIVTSVIYTYRQSESGSSASSARQFAQGLANAGQGKFFPVDSDTARPPDDLTFGQMAGQIAQTVVEQETKVDVNRNTDEVLADITTENIAIPSISGYYVAGAKASATSVLTVKFKKTETKDKDLPLYAYWNYGNGKVSSFTSTWNYKDKNGTSSNWISSWGSKKIEATDKTLGETFFDNVLYVNIPNEKNDYPYTLSVMQDGSAAQVLLIPHKETLHFDAVTSVKIIFPNGEVVNDSLIFNRSEYYYNFTSIETGRYQVEVVYSYLGTDYAATSIFNISYAAEYDEFAAFEASPLFRAINGRGQVIVSHVEDGVIQLEELKLENDEHEIGTYTNELTIPLLIIAVSLFVVDIIVRKLKWEDIVSFFGGYKKSQTEQGGKKQ